MPTFDNLIFVTTSEQFDTGYLAETLWLSGAGTWNIDPALIPIGGTGATRIRATGRYRNDPSVNATLRVYWSATALVVAGATLLLTVPLVADQGVFSTEAAFSLTAIPSSGFLFITLQRTGAGGSSVGLSYPSVEFYAVPGSVNLAVESVVKTGIAVDDFGTDISNITDISKDFALASSLDNLGKALLRRLSTPRGGLFYDDEYGLDIRSYLSAGMNQPELLAFTAAVGGECLKDDRIKDCTVDASYRQADFTLTLRLLCETEFGPYRLVLAVSAVTIEILNAGLAAPSV